MSWMCVIYEDQVRNTRRIFNTKGTVRIAAVVGQGPLRYRGSVTFLKTTIELGNSENTPCGGVPRLSFTKYLDSRLCNISFVSELL